MGFDYERLTTHCYLILAFSFLLSVGVMVLIMVTGGTPSVYMNLMYIPLALASTFSGRKRAFIFAVITGMMPWIVMAVSPYGLEPVKQLVTRPVSFMIISLVISSLSDFHRDRLIHEETYDAHTGLKKLQALKNSLKLNDSRSDLVMLTISNLQSIFTTFSYDFASDFIREFAHILKDRVKKYPGVEVYRLVENGFLIEVVCRQDCEGKRLESVLQDLLPIHKSIIDVDGVPVYVELKLGIATENQGKSPEESIKHASLALKSAQDSNRVSYRYEAELSERFLMQTFVLNHFRSAIGSRKLKLASQNIYTSRDKGLAAREFLIRWEHEEGRFISPAIFIPLIEKTDLIHDLTRFVIDEVLRYVSNRSAEERDVIASINFSSKDFSHANIEYLVRRIKESGVDPGRIQVEITEETLSQTAMLLSPIRSLKDSGVRIAIDDFGTGYSSYDLLAKLPIDVVKIDRSIVSSIDTEVRHKKLCENLVDYCTTFKIETVAEGVETESVAEACREIGIDYLQGFLFNRPQLIEQA